MRKPPLHVIAPFALLVATVVVACGSVDSAEPDVLRPGSAGPTSLEKTYVVSGVTEKGAKRPLVPGSEIRLAFADGQLRITAGCNTMSGGYVLDGTRLTVDSLATTEMGCEQALMAQDTWVAGLFADPVQLTTGNDAAIISGDVVLALTDREVASPDKPLTETVWVLDSLGEGGAVSSVGQVVAYVVFTDGRANVYDGCNEGSAPATVSDDEITFGDRTTTLRGCIGGPVEEVQEAFSAVVRGTATYTLDEQVLTITNGDRSLGFRAAEKLPQHD